MRTSSPTTDMKSSHIRTLAIQSWRDDARCSSGVVRRGPTLIRSATLPCPVVGTLQGWTETPLGPLQVFGVCIPWDQAHVSGGRRDRKRWQDHLAFLTGLAEVLPAATHDGRSVLLGDFNQTIPRTRAPKAVHEALMRALPEGMQVTTKGLIPDVGLRSIDHLVHTSDMVVAAVQGISNRSPDGHRLSDHFGLLVQLSRRA